ncbi:G protein coupled glucose receptor regulating Gpa2 protein [Ceratobasidium sp. AG-Ba]|nr:G protein coupled glucose receptor regulating Gpa2 protein [Ceratobasidium sp. AG-Ba]
MASSITDEQANALREAICHSKLLPKHRIGMSAITATGFLSSIAVIVLLGYTVRNHIQLRRLELAGPTRRSSTFFRTHVDFYMLSLLFADLLQGLGAMVNIEWIRGSQCYCGALCRAQGIIQILGESGVAMSTLAISVHTFVVIFFSWHPPTGAKGARIWGTVIGLIWLYLGLCVSVGFAVNQGKADSKHGTDIALEDFYVPTPFWCWIGQGYMIERIVFEYLWLWSTALISIVLYGILFLRLRGFISVDPRRWTRIRFHFRRAKSQDMSYVNGPNGVRLQAMSTSSGRLVIKQETSDALKLLYYPAAYTGLVLPLSIARWTTFDPSAPPDLTRTAANTPFTATAIVLCIFGLSGLVNVVMFISTRPNVLGFGARRQARAEKLREKGSGAISTFGSIGPTGRNQGFGSGSGSGGSAGDMRDGVLVMREITHSTTGMPSPGTPTGQTKSGHTLRFEVVEDSECELSDVEDDAKKQRRSVDIERADAPPVPPLPPAHTLEPRRTMPTDHI